jgi:hypothetical protein
MERHVHTHHGGIATAILHLRTVGQLDALLRQAEVDAKGTVSKGCGTAR